jgi:hypothetical protein
LRKVLSTYINDEGTIQEIRAIAEEKHTSLSTVLHWAIQDYLNPKLSPISIAALTQIAKDEGLDSLDEAVMHLARNGGQQ